MHEVLVNRLGGLSLPRKSVVRLTDRPDMTLDVYRGRKTTIQYVRIIWDGRVRPWCRARGRLDFFFAYISFSPSLSLRDGPIYTEILSERAV